MNLYKFTCILCLLFITGFSLLRTDVHAANDFDAQIVRLDPSVPGSLGNNEMLYVLVSYESDLPLRFQAVAARGKSSFEFGAISNPAALHAPGKGEALVWVGYTNPTHIDTVMVRVMDGKWRELSTLTAAADILWLDAPAIKKRELAEWVTTLVRSERRKMDYVYDPSPQKFGALYEIVFMLCIVSIPLYILLQLHMLWRYRYRWRELAVIPLFPYAILAFYMIVGLEVDQSFQVTFLFRYTPLALLYLVALWLAKRYWHKKLPPPKLYKQPKS